MITVILGMLVCFTLPLLIITSVLVCILWRKPKTADVESDAPNTTMKSFEVSKLSNVINSLYIALGLYKIKHKDSLTDSVANRLTRYGGIHNIEDLGRLTRHLTGVVIILNPALNSNKSEAILEKSCL